MKFVFALLVLVSFAFIGACNDQTSYDQPKDWATLSAGWEQSIDYRPGDDKGKELAEFEAAYETVDNNNGNGQEKVVICHIPPGNPDAAHTIVVGEPSVVQAHLAHGDTLGPCSVEDDGYETSWDGDDPADNGGGTPDTGGGDLGDVSTPDPGYDGCGNMDALNIEIDACVMNGTTCYASNQGNAGQWYDNSKGQYLGNFWMGTDLTYRVTITNKSDVPIHHITVTSKWEYTYNSGAHHAGDALAEQSLHDWSSLNPIPAHGSITLTDNYKLSYQNDPTFFSLRIIVRRYSGACLDGVAVHSAAEFNMYDPIQE